MNMRRLHRWVSIVAAVFVLYVAFTGFIMALDSVWTTAYMATHGLSLGGGPPPPALLQMFADDGTVTDSELESTLRTTLAAAGKTSPDALPPRVVRLRVLGGRPQGVVVSGDAVAEQLIFDAKTGNPAGLYETGYPRTPMPFQWDFHETVKRMHRGDYFGLTGRWVDLLTGVAILFLTVSGIVMYLQLYRVRGKIGRRGVFWK
jgi:hypothetical protein